MADRPITQTLPADLPETWTDSQYVSPSGLEVGLTPQHGYNYLMRQVNETQRAVSTINEAFDNLASLDPGTGQIDPDQVPLASEVLAERVIGPDEIQRDIQILGKNKEGKKTKDMPVTALQNITDTADLIEKPNDEDYIPMMDSQDKDHPFQMKKVRAAEIFGPVRQAQSDASKALEAVNKLAYAINAVPSQKGSLYYTGSPQSPEWDNFNTTQLKIAGDTTGTDVNTYSVTFTPIDPYVWAEGGKDPKTVTWTIQRARINVPTQSGTLTFNGAIQNPTWNGYDMNKMDISGSNSSTNAGTYQATFTPKANYAWSDGTTGPKNVSWTIARQRLTAVPSQSNTLTYTGNNQSPTWNNYDNSKLSLTGTTTGNGAGTYQATFTPTDNYAWSDGTYAAKNVSWSIGKAAGTMSLSSRSVSLKTGALTASVNVTRSGTGAITATSDATGKVTCSVSGTTINITGLAAGSATITVKCAGDSNYNAPADQTISVTVELPTSTLNSNSWSVIKAASDANQGSNYWKVGDTKSITINGTVQGFSISNFAVDAFIIGFNHNSGKEGGNRIHFQIGKVNGTNCAFCDSKYGNTGTDQGFRMNQSNTNVGGWKDSYGRKTLLGNSGTPTSPPAGSFMNALPSDLRNNMKSVTKYTDNVGNNQNNATSVTSTTDYLFFLAEFEVFGSRGGANSAEQNYQAQYSYYSGSNAKIFYKHNALTTAVWWWLRSPGSNYTNTFRIVDTDGAWNGYSAHGSGGVAPGFCV